MTMDEIRIDSMDLRHKRKDGTLIDVAVTSQELFFDGFEACLTLSLDVTDGKRRSATEARVVVVDDDPSWLRWPGRWGGVRTGFAGPTAPRDHPQWTTTTTCPARAD